MSCKLVGNLAVDPDLIISIGVGGSCDASYIDGQIIKGPTIGNVSVTGYAATEIFVGEMGRAGVSIEWARKYDCDNDVVYLLFSGARGYVTGGASAFAHVLESTGSVQALNASAANGPTSPYDDSDMEFGMGFSYNGSPISFTVAPTGPPSSVTIAGMNNLYLQNFSLECNPGQVPTANYSFVFVDNDATVG